MMSAKFIVEQVAERDRLETELIDIRNIAIANDDAGEPLKDPQFSATMERADGVPDKAVYEEGEGGLGVGGKVKTGLSPATLSPEVKRNNPNFMGKVKTSPEVKRPVHPFPLSPLT